MLEISFSFKPHPELQIVIEG